MVSLPKKQLFSGRASRLATLCSILVRLESPNDRRDRAFQTLTIISLMPFHNRFSKAMQVSITILLSSLRYIEYKIPPPLNTLIRIP